MISSERQQAVRTERDVVDGCRRGELPAFEDLYREHGSRLYNLAYRMTGSSADAEDLLQEIFLQVYRRLDSFRGESALGTWLYRLATNHCLDWLRSKQGKQQHATASIEDLEGFEPAASGAWRPDTALDRLDLERAIQQLPPSYRSAFVLHDVEGFEHGEVGRLLGIAEGTSKSLVHKARRRLRVLLRGAAAGPAVAPADVVTFPGRTRTPEDVP